MEEDEVSCETAIHLISATDLCTSLSFLHPLHSSPQDFDEVLPPKLKKPDNAAKIFLQSPHKVPPVQAALATVEEALPVAPASPVAEPSVRCTVPGTYNELTVIRVRKLLGRKVANGTLLFKVRLDDPAIAQDDPNRSPWYLSSLLAAIALTSQGFSRRSDRLRRVNCGF